MGMRYKDYINQTHYIDLTNDEDIDNKQSIVRKEDEIDMMLLKEFIEWFGDSKIELNRFEDKWYHFLDVREVK